MKKIIEKQRAFFHTGKTLPVEYRLRALKKLQQNILKYENEIAQALEKDLGKSANESYMCEIGMVLSEISYMIKHTKSYAKPRRVHTPIAQFCAKSYVQPSPYGVVLVMSPWNYPFLLTLDPLVDAIAAGNTAVVKPSAYAVHTSEIIKKLIEETFPEKYVTVVTGGRKENQSLLKEKFDYIFFTGGIEVGKEVMRQASANLTPVTLELGGKSPCIVDKTANIRLAARRIVFGKYLNCGQTCVAPDYIWCDASVKNELVAQMKLEVKRQFGEEPLKNKDYGKIINEKHFERLIKLLDSGDVVVGGNVDSETLQIEPTILDNVTFEDAVMQEEIFGPILPVLTYDNIEDVVEKMHDMPHPLACYIFTDTKKTADYVTTHVGFGGGCINDVVIHLATTEMGFGGFGESGMGSYHGKVGFDTFSHKKSIVDKKTWMDLPMRYQPYTSLNSKLIRLFLK